MDTLNKEEKKGIHFEVLHWKISRKRNIGKKIIEKFNVLINLYSWKQLFLCQKQYGIFQLYIMILGPKNCFFQRVTQNSIQFNKYKNYYCLNKKIIKPLYQNHRNFPKATLSSFYKITADNRDSGILWYQRYIKPQMV
jgi:hypothetical protein